MLGIRRVGDGPDDVVGADEGDVLIAVEEPRQGGDVTVHRWKAEAFGEGQCRGLLSGPQDCPARGAG